MTPRQQDVAFVLEGVPGVAEVYALTKPGVDLDFAVRVEPGLGRMAAAHYALLRVLDHEACRRVLFFETQLPASFAGSAEHLSLSTSAREESRTRVPERAAGEPMARVRVPSDGQFAALLVGCSKKLIRSVVDGLGAETRRVVESDPSAAAERALAEQFDVLLCDVGVAFGPTGFLELVHAGDPFVAARVILVAPPEERQPALARLHLRGRYNTCLTTPVDPETVLEIAATGFVVLPWSIPIPLPRNASSPRDTAHALRVVIIDDHAESNALASEAGSEGFRIDVADDAWGALDALGAEPRPALVICSASLRVGTDPLYRMLWGAHPELKHRFVLIAPPRATGDIELASRRLLIERPLTRDLIAEALRQRALL